MKDLWPHDLIEEDVLSPLAILKEQASRLGSRTRNLIEAEVKSTISEDEFVYSFFITASVLGDYRYKLFFISHGVEMYPLVLYPDREIFQQIKDTLPYLSSDSSSSNSLEINSEEQLLDALEVIFNAQRTRRIIASLHAQSSASQPF